MSTRRVIVFGATGMVGQGVLEACLRDDTITEVLVIGRSSTGRTHPKLRELHHEDFTDFTPIQDQLSGYDACFFCLGVSALGMTEAAYRAITVDFTLAAAKTLLAVNPDLAFCYVSGAGTDGTGKTRMMWARVKGELENTLLAMTPRAYMFRPAFILPLPGGKAKTKSYVLLYRVVTPLYPALRRLAPRIVTTSLLLGQAMIAVTRTGRTNRVLATGDINEVAAR
ncbi:NAD-dependent epimerase/dehydratase family protein [Cryptosporangium aurantiacum]|uniref:Semialdehyde dehydrogenase, NAD binding domain n=1 Tax=Cryptosporangium aurantiacum TaxID=134849 RepID=A0A1M7R4G0_9ACTN|nr:NAD-dependent epimerase/dehydratase family protein [Cryptosporangium aurantiacum]SHN39717.1 Semialdehyde dehydrogenase, NAD binding domain [Cryptosporangium aurantiacum]